MSTPAPSARGPALVAAVVVVVVVALGVGSYAFVRAHSTPVEHRVTYTVTGTTGTADVMWTGGSAVTRTFRPGVVRLPWKQSFTYTDMVRPLSVSAEGPGTGTLSCLIAVDGKEVAEGHDTASPPLPSCGWSPDGPS